MISVILGDDLSQCNPYATAIVLYPRERTVSSATVQEHGGAPERIYYGDDPILVQLHPRVAAVPVVEGYLRGAHGQALLSTALDGWSEEYDHQRGRRASSWTDDALTALDTLHDEITDLIGQASHGEIVEQIDCADAYPDPDEVDWIAVLADPDAEIALMRSEWGYAVSRRDLMTYAHDQLEWARELDYEPKGT